MKIKAFRNVLPILKIAAGILKKNDPLRLGAATSFFTIFALPFILLILINIFGIIFSSEIISGEIFSLLRRHIGTDSASQIQNILENFHDKTTDPLYMIFGSLFFIFVSTTLFIVIQNSINQVWNIKHSSRHRIKRVAKDRAISLGIIIVSGVIFLIAVLTDAILAFLGNMIVEYLPTMKLDVVRIINKIISIGLITLWFGILFRFLPNARIAWPVIWRGAFLTSILFAVGEFFMGIFLVESGLSNLYGAAGAILVIFLFVFYSSMILYFGAAFIKAYADEREYNIKPKKFASKYKIEEVQ